MKSAMRRVLCPLLLLAVTQASIAFSIPPTAPTLHLALPRSWAMGFGFVPPRPTVAAVIKGIDLWSQRAEIGAIHEELPWKDLLGGMSPDAILDRDKVELVKYMRAKGLKIYFMAELNDGLSRGEESPQLRALKRSITEPAVQQAYRNYVLAVAKKLKPDYLGLMAETNLVRAMAPATLYAAAVRAANDTAAALRAAGSKATLMTSVQVDAAWGVLGGHGPYVGVDKDFADFPFVEVMGLSSYPYFGYAKPEDMPDDYFSRLLNGRKMPVMVVEGGWSSASVGPVKSSPQLQARYVERLAQLADKVQARGVIQLLFADLDLESFPKPWPDILPLFTSIGLVDADFKPKPALAVWDRQHARLLKK